MAVETAARLVLASASTARREMLEKAGLNFDVIPADVDEAEIRQSLDGSADGHPEAVALRLAEIKAATVSTKLSGALVIGSDQVLALNTEIINKVSTREEARTKLKRLRGQVHRLHSAVALARGGRSVWSTVDTAILSMRDFDDAFLEAYLDEAGAGVLSSVGCYHIESLGVRLFESIEGSHFTILGMPLIPLLAELRRLEAVT